MIKAFRDTWELGIHSYLTYLRDRLMLARQLLIESGSVFVQIGDENLNLCTDLLDEIFGAKNRVSIITVQKTGGQETEKIPNVADYVVWYAKDISKVKYHQIYRTKEVGVGHGSGQRYDRIQLENGSRASLNAKQKRGEQEIPEGRVFQLTSLISSGVRTNTTGEWSFEGKKYHSGETSNWKTSYEGLERLRRANRIGARKTTIAYVRFIEDFAAFPISNIWSDVAGAAGIIYVVQTSASIVERCLLMTTDPGDLVLDPTCGSGTTAFVAEKWGRRWITCDTSRVAITLAKQRLMTASFDYYALRYPHEGLGGGFDYETVPHITLKSIANNPDIDTIHDEDHPKIAAALEAEQPFERRIDMIRPDWEAQTTATRDLVQRLAARIQARLDPEPPHPPHDHGRAPQLRGHPARFRRAPRLPRGAGASPRPDRVPPAVHPDGTPRPRLDPRATARPRLGPRHLRGQPHHRRPRGPAAEGADGERGEQPGADGAGNGVCVGVRGCGFRTGKTSWVRRPRAVLRGPSRSSLCMHNA